MGGVIGFTLRRADGTEQRTARWTNPFSHILMDPKFIEGPDSFWDKSMAQDEYEKWGLLAPLGYGLIVIDYQNKIILHSQGYSAMVKLLPGEFTDIPMHTGTQGWPDERVVKLIEQGRVTRERWDGAKWITPLLDHEIKSWEAENKRCKDEGYPSYMRNQYPVDMSPWTVEQFPESGDGCREMKARLAELGFKFSEDEEDHWAEFYAELDEENEEA